VTAKRENSDGSIWQDKGSGRWRVAISWRGKDGELYRKHASAATRSEALAKLHELQLAQQLAQREPSPATTLGEYLQDWLANVVPALPITARTKADYANFTKYYLLAGLGEIPLGDLRPEHLEALFATMAAQGKARNTIRLARATLSRSLGHALRRGYVSSNVAMLSILPASAKPAKERRVLSHEQAARLTQALAGEKDEALWLSSLLLGLRPGEAVALSWDDIDCENEVLHVARARKWTPDGWVIGPPKTRRGQRAIKMPPRLAEAFRRMVPKEPHELVFATSSKTLLDPSNLRKRLFELCAKAGIEPCTPYELRHSAASLLSDNGVPIEVLADLLGHSSTQMLEQVYRHRIRKVIDVTSPTALGARPS